MYMLRVVIGSNNIPASELPREDLVLCNDIGRVALQAILPKYDAKGILERAFGMTPRPEQILGDDGDGVHQDSGAARALVAGVAGGAVDPRDSRRVGKLLRSLSPPEVAPTMAMPQCMEHDAEASGSSWPRDDGASRSPRPGAGETSAKARPTSGEGDASTP
ncbi:hypothetical protein E2562_003204 [Oryza meyeriana var. granulata]|uniref:Uncharacterized protein n=1 Tax=Oryza meyeriana var. granulata TaxID=110450 RepID=A0A6G1EUS8_9ORYZ|nr:hypothetical protein E2562_003204 [Oryza meyeriana var. granulata]